MTISIESIEGYGIKKKDKPVVQKSRYKFSKVGLVGCGILGQEISRMVSSHGLDVTFIEVSPEKIEQALLGISNELDNMIERKLSCRH